MQFLPIEVLRIFAEQLDRQVADAAAPESTEEATPARRKLANAYLNVAKRMAEAGYPEDSLACYRKSLTQAPDDQDLHYDALFPMERLNRVREAWDILQSLETTIGTPCDPGKPLFILKARLQYRRGNLETCRAMLEGFLNKHPAHTHRHLAWGWLGTALDELGHYDDAMAAFNAKNEVLLRTPTAARLLRKNDIHLTEVDESIRWYGDRRSFGWQETAPLPADSSRPVLLVGFPRSGTTLLDQLLDSHPALSVIEEKATLHGIAERFFGNAAHLESLQRLSEAEMEACRQTYWSNISGIRGHSPGKSQVVDKQPLNIMHLDIYARLFPGVKVVVAIRDPRDVVLSNYMQLYQLNPSMAANLSLERSARYYSKVMGLYLLFRRLMPDNVHEVRYERLVQSLEEETAALMQFLGLEWKDEVLRFHEHARRRPITTPSYHQVVKSIYGTSAGRWKNYRAHTEAVLPLLQPFIEAFGYSSS
ncbi:MAG TPA: sulfotransferase [Rhodocyclaceae bacterium]|nr:sulfotransferase [Rhodocyclaceae bacterium]